MSSSKSTKDHDQIRRWIEERNGKPSVVRSTHKKEDSGVLRVNFPGFKGEDTLEEVDWEEFFAIFDDRDLTFLYQDETKEGKESRFFKFVSGSAEPRRKEGAEQHGRSA